MEDQAMMTLHSKWIAPMCAVIGILLAGAPRSAAQSGWQRDRHDESRSYCTDARYAEGDVRRLSDEIRRDERRVHELLRDYDRALRDGRRWEAQRIRERIDRIEDGIRRNWEALDRALRRLRDDRRDRDWHRR
jgi:hypothetical protein